MFQNRAKIIPIQDEKHFPYIPIYIDLNPIDLISVNSKKKLNFIKSYEWSSLKNYYEEREDSEVINQELFYKIFETNPSRYEDDLKGFLGDRERLEIELEANEGVNLRG